MGPPRMKMGKRMPSSTIRAVCYCACSSFPFVCSVLIQATASSPTGSQPPWRLAPSFLLALVSYELCMYLGTWMARWLVTVERMQPHKTNSFLDVHNITTCTAVTNIITLLRQCTGLNGAVPR